MTDVSPVTFTNRDGLTLFGMLHLPQQASRRPIAVLLLSPGIKMRVAPHRLYNKMAAIIADLGFPVLRFDFHGLGDSEGELGESTLAEVYNSIQSGRFVGDTLDAIEWMQREYGIRQFIAAGLCGGAITGLLTAKNEARIEGLLALGIPASFEGSAEEYDQYLTRGELEAMSRRYVSKLRSPKAVFRLLTLQSSYKGIWRAFRARFGAQRGTPPPAPTARDNRNPLFAPAFLAMVATSRRALLIFSGADRWQWEFEEKFEEPNAQALAPYRSHYEKHTIAAANHVLSDERWLGEAIEISKAWLVKHYPPDRT